MNSQDILERYTQICSKNLRENDKALKFLKRHGIYDSFIFENFSIGFSDGEAPGLIGGNEAVEKAMLDAGIIKAGKDTFKNCLIIPILDENKAIVNLAGCSIYSQSKNRHVFLNDSGIFNGAFISHAKEIILTENPLNALFLIQNDCPNATFLFGSDNKYVRLISERGIRKVTFTFEGRARLFYELEKTGVSARRAAIDFEKVKSGNAKEILSKLLSEGSPGDKADNNIDSIREIENGFQFQLPLLSYRVIGNFSEHAMNLKANIKAYTETDVFVDSIDLYKNRDRQNFIYNLMDKFNIRDQLQLENDLNQIIEVIEKHKEKKAGEKKRQKPELTEHQKEIGLSFLESPHLLDEIEDDYTKLGYVRERKNKILLYLVMTSRLMDNPLHSIIISRSGAGKSLIVELTEILCPPEDVESVSDLSAQALFYYGKDDLKNKFIVIGEKKGSEGSDYPLRELITKKSITKAVPMKDPVTGQIKTVSIKVNGPISLTETTTNGDINPENLNRCFVIGIDESEDQTRLIHELQRRNYTAKGYLTKQRLNKVTQKHIYSQRLLKKVTVFNPYAELLSFPTSKLKTRRDNDKFLRLINVICFLHQYQRKVKKLKVADNQTLEYIECTPEDYSIAYELLSDGVLDNTLDDLPRSARELLDLVKKYLMEKSKCEDVPTEKIIFERKEIREYTSWSFAQVRNNFRILKDYEYIQLIRSKNGLADQYRISCNYTDIDFLHKILTPEELKRRIETLGQRKNLNRLNVVEHSAERVLTH